MRYLLSIALLFVCFEVYSQGFDWQYSFRLPYFLPSKFIGISGGYSINSSVGDFDFLEDYTPCCKYQSGSGNSFEIGLVYEKWISAISAITVKTSYINTNTNFSQTIQIPRSDGINDYLAKYNYKMTEERSSLNLSGLYKYRLMESHLSVLGGLTFSFHLADDAKHTEAILSPETEQFIDGTRSRVIKRGVYGEYNNTTFSSVIGLNYDYAITKGYYSSISASINLPVSNVINNQEWKEWKFLISISILKSID